MSNKQSSRNNMPIAIPIVAVLLWAVFIFANSLRNAEESSQTSSWALELIRSVLPFDLSEYMIRKAAHFTEFAVLGLFVRLLMATVSRSVRRKNTDISLRHYDLHICGWFLLIGIVVAITDEMLQYTSQGRSPEVRDCVIDICGYVTGFALTWIAIVIFRRIKKRRRVA